MRTSAQRKGVAATHASPLRCSGKDIAMVNRLRIVVVCWIMFAAHGLAARAAFAQLDISGEWGVRYHEDYWHRQAGPEVGDYVGLPINDAARLKAQSWQEAVLAEPERQCIPHVATYSMRGPANIRISKMVDPLKNGATLAYRVEGMFGRADRTIWMDGRSHPPEYAKHTYAGFSTGEWEGNKLKVTTTHIKMGWIQRNGVPTSDQATMTEYFIRHENSALTVMTIIEDPIYLDEPMIRTTDWLLDLGLRIGQYPCGPDQIDVEAEGFEKHHVPHHLPGQNDQLEEFASSRNVPVDAAMGGVHTLYPEYMARVTRFQADAAARRAASLRAGTGDPFFGRWLLHRGKSTFTGTEVQNSNGGVITSTTLPAKRTMKYDAAGRGIRHTIDTQPLANDTGFNRVEYTALFDGKDYPIKGSVLETVSVKRHDPRTIERTGKIGGQVVETATATVSADGMTLTVTTKGTVKGSSYSNIQVYERQ
jgi:hypothetical protein